MRHALLALLALSLGTGCHARFKKMAPTLGDVHPEVHLVTQPNVQLGGVSGGGVAGDVVNLVQVGRSYELSRQLAERVDTDSTSAELASGVVDVVGEGPPFSMTADKGGSVLQIEVVDMGMEVYGLGAPGVFDYDLRVRIFRDDGKLAYKTRLTCTTAAGSPDAVAATLFTVNNAKQLKEMSDEELQGAFDAVAHYCGSQLGLKMRRHAG
ncbi:MAG: hypothetical protein EP330_29180 [Deltaproteobacteria bacterium]|nr:MAG: hypothetical protein EP330_29180 [Deltaproteobacteria bacterium]